MVPSTVEPGWGGSDRIGSLFPHGRGLSSGQQPSFGLLISGLRLTVRKHHDRECVAAFIASGRTPIASKRTLWEPLTERGLDGSGAMPMQQVSTAMVTQLDAQKERLGGIQCLMNTESS